MAFEEFIEDVAELATVLHLSMNGIAMLESRHAISKAVQPFLEIEDEEQETERLAEAERESELARTEVENGFPVLHRQATVSLWSHLENLIRSFLAHWLTRRPSAWKADVVRKLRVRVGEYHSLKPFERSMWIVDLLDKELAGPLRSGVNRFEAILTPFGLSGPVDETCRRTIYELSQVRNAIVHRRARADRTLVNACPWLDLKVGSEIVVSHRAWRGYQEAVLQYVHELIFRVRDVYGIERPGKDE